MQYSIYVNQLFVAQHPECGDLDFTDLAIFDCIRKMLEGKWGDRRLVDGVLWKNLRTTKVLEEMPLLRTSRDKPMSEETVRKRIAKLCDAGLLQKDPRNKGTRSAFIALGELADSYDKDPEISTTVEFDHLNGRILPSQRSNSTNYQSTDQNTLSNSFTGDSASESLPKEKRVPKKKLKLTRIEVEDFYESELTNSLKDPLPPEVVAAAARRPEITHDLLFKAYKELVGYMTGASDMWPNGMWRCVLTKPDQLSFVQFCKLVLERGMTRAEIKSYLDQWENKLYDNNNLYATIVAWRNREATNPQKPFNGNANLPIRATKSTNETYNH